jgi:hypothetical protein
VVKIPTEVLLHKNFPFLLFERQIIAVILREMIKKQHKEKAGQD